MSENNDKKEYEDLQKGLDNDSKESNTDSKSEKIIDSIPVADNSEIKETPNKKSAKDFKFNVDPEKLFDDESEKEKATVQVEEDVAEVGKKKKVKRKGTGFALVYALVVVIVSVSIAFVVLYSLNDMLALFRPESEKDVDIPMGASNAQIASTLKDKGIILNEYLFLAYLKLSKASGFQHGTYTLDSKMDYPNIVDSLKNPANNRALVSVTIPEGLTAQKIADLLEKNNVCSRQSFLDEIDKKHPDFSFDSMIPDDQNRYYRLEGYLFPDTYQFMKKQSAESVLKKILSNFEDKFKEAQNEAKMTVQNSGITSDQIVILASIVQTEAGKVDEMSNISSVFHNRLEIGVDGNKILQSDATIFYIKRNIQPFISKEDTELQSAYNTYKTKGLPPGAICNPGKDALKAALNPPKTNYFYFVSDKNNKYYYSETYKQHIAAVNKAIKTGAATGTNAIK